MLNRRGVTLLELLVTTVIGCVALALVASVSVRQQRVLADLADAGASSAQLGDAAAILPIDLRAVSSAAGDIHVALDTALEVRAATGAAVICDTANGAVILAPSVSGAAAYAGYVTALEVGDTAWVLSPSDTSETWAPLQITATTIAPAGDCAALGPALDDSARVVHRIAVTLAGTATVTPGMAIRVTRPIRYSLYHAGDGAWYLGQRDWNAQAGRFNAIQPVSGPFLSPALAGLAFQYMDSAGGTLPIPVPNTKSVAVVRVDLRSQTRVTPRALSAAASVGRRHDSTSVWILLRNRR